MGMVTFVRDWMYNIDFPDDGWVWAPEPDEDIAAWAQEVSADLFAEGEDEVRLSAQLRAYATAYRDKECDAGALWIPHLDHGVLATLTTETLVGEPGEPLTLDTFEQLERSIDDPKLAPSLINQVQLPAGPAVRARRVEVSANLFGNDGISELVSHVIVPDPAVTDNGLQAAVRHVVSWQMLEEGDDLAELADDCAQLITIVRS